MRGALRGTIAPFGYSFVHSPRVKRINSLRYNTEPSHFPRPFQVVHPCQVKPADTRRAAKSAVVRHLHNPSCEKYFASGAVHYHICHRQHAGLKFRASARWLVQNALGLVHLGRDDAICDVIREVVLRSMHEYKRSSHDRSEHVLWEIIF